MICNRSIVQTSIHSIQKCASAMLVLIMRILALAEFTCKGVPHRVPRFTKGSKEYKL